MLLAEPRLRFLESTMAGFQISRAACRKWRLAFCKGILQSFETNAKVRKVKVLSLYYCFLSRLLDCFDVTDHLQHQKPKAEGAHRLTNSVNNLELHLTCIPMLMAWYAKYSPTVNRDMPNADDTATRVRKPMTAAELTSTLT
jgi:hypothetical protein